MIDALMIYPRLGSNDSMICDPPLSIIYASAESVKRGHDVKALDLRTHAGDFRPIIRMSLDQGVRLVGISVMTGAPLRNARDVARYIREAAPKTKIVFGGPHATLVPDTIQEDFIDFLVRGYGSKALAELIDHLKSGREDFSDIPGLSFKKGDQAIHNPRETAHELLPFREIPYHLLDLSSPQYARAYMGERVFPIFTAIGCPYQCSFCVHPTVYSVIQGSKWIPISNDEIIDHMRWIIGKYSVGHFCIMDDTSFPDIERMREFFLKIIARNLNVILEFRGARINEIARMDDDFLNLMTRAGGRVLMVGVESGSDRILRVMQKGITKEQILEANRKLARHPEITPHYNFIYGTPGETYEDLLETKEVVLQLLRENSQAFFGFGGDWKPIPGSRMVEVAETYAGFHTPKTYDEWIEMDSSDAKHKIEHPWYTRNIDQLIRLLQISSFVIDNKIIRNSAKNGGALFRVLRLLSRTYKPIALFRLYHNMHAALFEYTLWQFLVRHLPRLTRFSEGK